VLEQAEQFLKKLYLDGVARELLRTSRRILWHFKRQFGRIDNRIVERYLSSHEIRALHVGCGDNLLEGWLQADLFPDSALICHLDATQPFPFGDETFDYIFSEHMIEHIPYTQGIKMLSECCRVLKGNSKIRISTPDLAFLTDLYKEKKSDLQKEYIKWATNRFIDYAPYGDDTFVINNFVRDWGHQFIYDEKTLTASLEEAGFTNICKCEINESEEDTLRNLENEKRMPDGFLRLESITLEGTKGPYVSR
jgi:predicted SAM-dependent methyltransferase